MAAARYTMPVSVCGAKTGTVTHTQVQSVLWSSSLAFRSLVDGDVSGYSAFICSCASELCGGVQGGETYCPAAYKLQLCQGLAVVTGYEDVDVGTWGGVEILTAKCRAISSLSQDRNAVGMQLGACYELVTVVWCMFATRLLPLQNLTFSQRVTHSISAELSYCITTSRYTILEMAKKNRNAAPKPSNESARSHATAPTSKGSNFVTKAKAALKRVRNKVLPKTVSKEVTTHNEPTGTIVDGQETVGSAADIRGGMTALHPYDPHITDPTLDAAGDEGSPALPHQHLYRSRTSPHRQSVKTSWLLYIKRLMSGLLLAVFQ
ncbi:hypothetical protein J3A83DRAFT_4402257 [Scleroderma citrinum]